MAKQTAITPLHDSGRSGAEHLPLHHRRRQARAAVAGRRAQFLPTSSKKPTVMAMEEVRRGLVKYEDIADRCTVKQPARRRVSCRVIDASHEASLLGVGGGIAAYKAAELARASDAARLHRAGHDDARGGGVRPPADVRRPHRAQSDHRPVQRRHRGRYAFERDRAHLASRRSIEILVVAPATADLLAKFAHGLADDFLTTRTWRSPVRWCSLRR